MAEDMYAAVDMTKKKKNHPISLSKPVPLDTTYSMVTAPECPPTYAAVDMSKKRKDKVPEEHETALSDTTTASLYDVANRDRQEKKMSQTFDANYSTLDLQHSTAAKNTPHSLPQPAETTKKHIMGSLKPSKTECASCNKVVLVFTIINAVIAVAVSICLGILFAEVADFNKEVDTLSQAKNISDQMQRIIQKEVDNLSQAKNISDQMQRMLHQQIISNHSAMIEWINKTFATQDETLNRSINSSLHFLSDNIMMLIISNISAGIDERQERNEEMYSQLMQNISSVIESVRDHSLIYHATSCSDLPPSSPSGYYWVKAPNSYAVHVYCDMTRSCGGVTGGWTRVVYLNMTASSQQCSSHGLIPQTSSGEQRCVISNDDAGCSSVNYSTHFSYSKICGKILAHSTGNPDGFGTHERGDTLTLESNYVDGVSLTHGHPRQHIWSFAAVNSHNCMLGCNPPSSLQLVHSEYFCDDVGPSLDILWDGNGCSLNSPPWFYRQLPQPITGSIEMRVCRDEGRSNEDIGIEHIEIYVQ